jgi:hypothetical protein
MDALKGPKLEVKSRLLLLSFFKKRYYDNQPPTDDPLTIRARWEPFYFRDGYYFPRFLLVSNSYMNTIVADYDSEENDIEIEWDAEMRFYFRLGNVEVNPTDPSVVLLMLRLAKITRIRMKLFDEDEPSPASIQKWIQACTALKRESIFIV